MPILNDVLAQAGLDEKEAEVYITLLNNGGLTIVGIANKSGQKRTNLYNIVTHLKNLNLVKEIKEGSTTKYYPQSPREIEKLIESKAQMLQHAKLNYEIIINSLHSQYKLTEKNHLVTYYEGLTGLKQLY